MQPMINAVYQLIAPRMIDVTYQEMHLSGSQVLIRPLYLSICHADQRYYQGMRSEAALKAKLPMALIHECVAEVIYDPTGAFQVGDRVIPIPNSPTQTDDIIAENYLRSSFFRSSGYDGFLQDYVMLKPDRLVPAPKACRSRWPLLRSSSALVAIRFPALILLRMRGEIALAFGAMAISAFLQRFCCTISTRKRSCMCSVRWRKSSPISRLLRKPFW